MTHYIYTLIDPTNNQIRYVGQTTRKINVRLRQHINDAKKMVGKQTHKNNWIRKLLNENYEPLISVVYEANENNWKELEKYLINLCKENGIKLLNISDGGDSGSMPNKKRVWPSNESYMNWKSKVTDANKNRKINQETRDKMAENCRKIHKGKKRTDSTKLKLSNSKIGEKNPMFGTKHTPENKIHLSKVLRGKSMSPMAKSKLQERNNKNKKRVIQKTKDGMIIKIFESVLAAKKETKCHNINKVLNGKMKYCGGFLWEYYENEY